MSVHFAALWAKHPSIMDLEHFPCKKLDGSSAFANQGAIRMGVCLARNGFQLSELTQCWLHDPREGHTLKSQEIANWLKEQDAVFGTVQICSRMQGVLSARYESQTGIVFFKNFGRECNGWSSIDLWNGFQLAHGQNDYFDRAAEIWFWPIN